MKFTWDVRNFAVTQGVDEQTALQKGMEQKSAEFVQQGASILSQSIAAQASISCCDV